MNARALTPLSSTLIPLLRPGFNPPSPYCYYKKKRRLESFLYIFYWELLHSG
jgi:hypothetical protein